MSFEIICLFEQQKKQSQSIGGPAESTMKYEVFNFMCVYFGPAIVTGKHPINSFRSQEHEKGPPPSSSDFLPYDESITPNTIWRNTTLKNERRISEQHKKTISERRVSTPTPSTVLPPSFMIDQNKKSLFKRTYSVRAHLELEAMQVTSKVVLSISLLHLITLRYYY